MTILNILNNELVKIFEKLNFDKKYAFFQYSDRPDLSDFQTNCAMPLAKTLKKNPVEIASIIVKELENTNLFSKTSVDGPGFINISVTNDFLAKNVNDKIEYKVEPKDILLEYFSPNVAKEAHVGHLKNAILGGSLERIYKFAGNNVRTDNHIGDWGTNMGMVIEAIKTKYPHIKCFQKGFNGDSIDDLNLTPNDLLILYQFSNIKAKEDKEYYSRVLENTKLLQQKYKPYYVLWQYFYKITLDDMKDICKILNVDFDTNYGESFYQDMCLEIVEELKNNGDAIISEGLWVIPLDEIKTPPFILQKSDGSFLYSTTDLAAVKYRVENYNPDYVLYVVDFRQSLHFKQLFTAGKKVGYIKDNNNFEHISYGTINGKDGKPYKTRSGDVVKIRDLINETIAAIREKSTIKDNDTIQKIAIACLKFADLINFRESSYIFDMDQFTNFEGKTGAYLLYNLVRIKSILANYEKFDYKITEIRTPEEKDLLMELSKFNQIFKASYDKRAPHFIAEYAYSIAKKFSSFYSICPINNEKDEKYKKSKISLLNLTKTYMETCLNLLNIESVERM